MPVFEERTRFSRIPVRQAMRRQIERLGPQTPVSDGIRRMIRAKVNAVLVEDAAGRPLGVVSKTDLAGAYLAGLPADTPAADVMAGPIRCCREEDRLEDALDAMQRHGIHRLYVHPQGDEGRLAGVLAYSDIVGLLYRYCRGCPHSRAADGRRPPGQAALPLAAADVMTAPVAACDREAQIAEVIETLLARRVGAVLITGDGGLPAGVISKTDLALAYAHGMSPGAPAEAAMSRPVVTTAPDTPLAEAIRTMLLHDVQRVFVAAAGPALGVLSLSDAARFRSGTCRACGASRLLESI